MSLAINGRQVVKQILDIKGSVSTGRPRFYVVVNGMPSRMDCSETWTTFRMIIEDYLMVSICDM